MVEYSIRIKTKAGSSVVMNSMVTSDLKAAHEQLAQVKKDIANSKWPFASDAEIVVREITPWCELVHT